MISPQHLIFISHSHLDNAFGSQLAKDLRQVLGDEQAVWYDVLGGLHGGDTWWEKIVEELTARDIFLLILSPEAMTSRWVRREINIALNEDKKILPVHYRRCNVRADLRIYQIISFLPPKTYQAAFEEVLVALGLSTDTAAEYKEDSQPGRDRASVLLQEMEMAFSEQDWPAVIRKANYLISHMPASASSTVYRMQGLAFLEEGKLQQAQEALETALALVNDRQQRLTLLSDYTSLLAHQQQWDEVLQCSREALRLAPNDPAWLATQQQAQNQLARPSSVPQPPPAKQQTKEQWADESKRLNELKLYEEALVAADQAIHLDPNFVTAYLYKGDILRNLKHYEDAIAAYDQAIHLDPNLAVSYDRKAIALFYLRRFEEVLPSCDQAIHLDPNFADAYNIKGATLFFLNRYEESLSACDQAIHLDPNFADAYFNKGITLNALGKHKEAQQAFEKAKELGLSD